MDGYGFSASNPVRVSGFYEEKRYLECLRVSGKAAPLFYVRLGSCCTEDTGHPVDVYRLGAKGLFRRRVLLYIDIYGERDWRAPAGYKLTGSAPKEDEGGEEKETADKLMKAILRITKNIR